MPLHPFVYLLGEWCFQLSMPQLIGRTSPAGPYRLSAPVDDHVLLPMDGYALVRIMIDYD